MDQGQLRWGDGAALTLALSPRVLRTAHWGCCARPLGVLRTATGEGERDEMMKNEPSRLRSIKPNPTKSNQIRPNQTKSDQIKPNQTGSRRVKGNSRSRRRPLDQDRRGRTSIWVERVGC